MQGVFISGILVDKSERKRDYDGKVSVNYSYLLVVNGDPFKITSDNDFRDKIEFGDYVTFKCRVRSYNNTIYYNGDLIEEED